MTRVYKVYDIVYKVYARVYKVYARVYKVYQRVKCMIVYKAYTRV